MVQEERGKKTSTRAMNTSSLQKIKMAARLSHLPSTSNPTKMRISPIKLQGRMAVPRMVATSEKNVQLAFLNDQAKQLKSMI